MLHINRLTQNDNLIILLTYPILPITYIHIHINRYGYLLGPVQTKCGCVLLNFKLLVIKMKAKILGACSCDYLSFISSLLIRIECYIHWNLEQLEEEGGKNPTSSEKGNFYFGKTLHWRLPMFSVFEEIFSYF